MVTTTNLVSYWKMDDASGNIIDAHGSNDGTYNGSLYSQTGKINNAIGFDGSNDFVDTGANFNNNNLSVFMWANFDDVTTRRTLISKFDHFFYRTPLET